MNLTVKVLKISKIKTFIKRDKNINFNLLLEVQVG